MGLIFQNMCRGILLSALYDANRPTGIIPSYVGQNQTKFINRSRRKAGCKASPCANDFSEPGPNGTDLNCLCN